MPISLDLDHITGRFQSIGRFQLQPIAEMFERLGQWLTKRVKQADLLDQASRGFPVVRFYNEAVTLWIDPIQHGALAVGEPPSFGQRLRAAGEAFLRGLDRIPEAIAEERLLPRLFAGIANGLEAIEASIARWETPTPDMFNPELRTASDLFGEAALGLRAILFSRDQIQTFLFEQVYGAYRVFTGADNNNGDGEPKPADPRGLGEKLDGYTRYFAAALLLIPALQQFLVSTWESALIFIKDATITAFAGVEARVFDLRRTVIDFFTQDFLDLVQEAMSYVEATARIFTTLVGFWLDFGWLYSKTFLVNLSDFLNQLALYFNWWAVFIQSTIADIDDILDYDLTPIIASALGGILGYLVSKIGVLPELTVADLVHGTVRDALVAWIENASDELMLIDPFDLLGYQKRLDALAKAVNIAFSPPEDLGPDTRPIAPPPPFPSVYDLWLKTSGAAALRKGLTNLADSLSTDVVNIVDSADGAVQRIGFRFDDAAAAAAHGISDKEMRRLIAGAASLAGQVFGPEAEALRARVDAGQKDLVVTTFEAWVADGGFKLVEQSLSQYIGGLIAAWREEEARGDEVTVVINQTSPQILAKKARLARAHMKELTIDARGRALDDELVAEIAARFRGAVQGAYLSGKKVIHDRATAVEITVV